MWGGHHEGGHVPCTALQGKSTANGFTALLCIPVDSYISLEHENEVYLMTGSFVRRVSSIESADRYRVGGYRVGLG